MNKADQDRLLSILQPALTQERHEDVLSILSELTAGGAVLGRTWRQLVNVAAYELRWDIAIAASELQLAQTQGDALDVFAHATLLRGAGRFEEALDLATSIPAMHLQNGAREHFIGSLHTVLGNTEEAEEQLLLALEQSKRSAHYWFALVANGSATSPKIRRMLLDAQQSSSQMDHPAVFQYALGEALDSWGEYPAAFENFSAAAARLRAERPYQRDAIEQNLQRAVRDNSAAAIGANAQNSARNDVRSIIVTGMPRSGTTLVEQILSSHSAVDDGAELGLFRILSRNAGTSDSGPLQASGQNLTTLGKYHQTLLQARFPKAGCVVDKTLLMSRQLGLVASLLPDTPLVWVTRDPIENGWSAFKTYFRAGHAWSCDLGDTVHFVKAEQQFLQFWKGVLGRRLLVVSHEELIQAPETVITTLLDHCGLAHENACFRPHETQRAVATASTLQVRKPIGAGASTGSGPYRQWLGPLLQGLDND